ncbi:hypothetical protein AAMO2058_000822200 [Amorphochlora amoebiformis]
MLPPVECGLRSLRRVVGFRASISPNLIRRQRHFAAMAEDPLRKLQTPRNKSRQPAVLLMCGSFSPITLMHLRLLESARDYLTHNHHRYEVIGGFVSPVGDAYGKDSLETSLHRKSMAHLATKTSPWVTVSTWEMDRPNWTPTKEVIGHVRESVNTRLGKLDIEGVACLLVCGGDLIHSFIDHTLWSDDDVNQIFKDGAVVMPRDGTDMDEITSMARLKPFSENLHILPYDLPNSVSSSLVREMLKSKRSPRYLLDDNVLDYIYCHELYNS